MKSPAKNSASRKLSLDIATPIAKRIEAICGQLDVDLESFIVGAIIKALITLENRYKCDTKKKAPAKKAATRKVVAKKVARKKVATKKAPAKKKAPVKKRAK